MQNAVPYKSVVAVALVAAIGLGLYATGTFSSQFTDGGVDVRSTACEDLSSARLAVATELGERKQAAQASLDAARENASDEYWATNQELEREYHACISRALTADPCKEPFEKITKLYEEIMADFESGKGFNEAKFNEREAAKKEYNDCVAEARKPETYKDKETACNAALASGKEANQVSRTAKEAVAKTQYDDAIARAESAHNQKQAILDAIEKKCTEPGKTSKVRIGGLTTEGSGAAIQSGSAACTGVFPGNDPAIQRQISNLENQLQKAKAAGERGGLTGIDHIQEALDRVREELKDSPRTCKIDTDCGDPAPVCCSGTEIGRAFCSAGVCSTEKTTCVSPEICAGKPAQCVAPFTGAEQKDGVYITRTIPEVGACSQKLEVLDLVQSTPDSARYSITGNIPSWLHIDKPGGTLPGKVDVSYSCNTVQKMGPGVHTANGSITVYNATNELINTIPFNVAITVTPAPIEMVDAIEYNGKFLPTSQLIVENEEGCGANHWHAARGVVTATDGSKVSDPGPQCGYGKVSEKPAKKVPAVAQPSGNVEIRGLEGLKTR